GGTHLGHFRIGNEHVGRGVWQRQHAAAAGIQQYRRRGQGNAGDAGGQPGEAAQEGGAWSQNLKSLPSAVPCQIFISRVGAGGWVMSRRSAGETSEAQVVATGLACGAGSVSLSAGRT